MGWGLQADGFSATGRSPELVPIPSQTRHRGQPQAGHPGGRPGQRPGPGTGAGWQERGRKGGRDPGAQRHSPATNEKHKLCNFCHFAHERDAPM